MLTITILVVVFLHIQVLDFGHNKKNNKVDLWKFKRKMLHLMFVLIFFLSKTCLYYATFQAIVWFKVKLQENTLMYGNEVSDVCGRRNQAPKHNTVTVMKHVDSTFIGWYARFTMVIQTQTQKKKTLY